jgi:sugar phosphate isomerase/epimerase
MAETAAKAEIHLLVENEGACNVATCAELAALMKLVPSKWIGINWDLYNGVAYKAASFRDGYRLLPKDRAGNAQAKAGSGWKHAPARTGYRLPTIQ